MEGGERQRGRKINKVAVFMGNSFRESRQAATLSASSAAAQRMVSSGKPCFWGQKSPARQQQKVAACRTRKHCNHHRVSPRGHGLRGSGATVMRTRYGRYAPDNDTCPPVSSMRTQR